jgi:DNA-binding MarR family transcriptional regulator
MPLKLTPPHAGIPRILKQSDGLSQQALSEKLGKFPSRLVAVLDELERRGIVKPRDSPSDRRSYAVVLTKAGRGALENLKKYVAKTRSPGDSITTARPGRARSSRSLASAGFLPSF